MNLPASVAPAVIGTVRRRVAAFVEEQTRSSMRAEVVKGDKVTAVVEDHEVAGRPFQLEIVVVGRQFTSMSNQVPVLAGESIF